MYCRKHPSDSARSVSPASSSGPRSSGKDASLASSLRKQMSPKRAEPRGEPSADRKVHFSPPRRLQTRPAEAEPFTLLEQQHDAGHLHGNLALVRLKAYLGEDSRGDWFIFKGITAEVASDSRRQERVLADNPKLGFQVSIPVHCVDASPQIQSRSRLPKEWLQQHLHMVPVSGLAASVCLHAALVPEGFSTWLDGWEGTQIVPSSLAPARLSNTRLELIRSTPANALRSTEEGRLFTLSPALKRRAVQDFSMPPQPPAWAWKDSASPNHVEELPSALEVQDLLQECRDKGLTQEESVGLVSPTRAC